MSVSVDPAAMSVAVPAIEALSDLLARADRALAGVDVPSGVVGAGDVAGVIASARRRLAGTGYELAAIPADLRRRVSAAQLAAAPWMTALGGLTRTGGMFAASFSIQSLSRSAANGWALRLTLAGLRDGQRWAGGGPGGALTAWRMTSATASDAYGGPARGVPGGLARGAQMAGKVLKFGGWAMTAYGNVRNPYLSDTQKVTRTAASIATGTGVSVASGMAAGAMFGSAAGPAGFLIGAGAGLAWSVADSRLGISSRIGDAAATVVDAAGNAAGAVAHTGAHLASGAAHAGAHVATGAAGVVSGGAKKLWHGLGL